MKSLQNMGQRLFDWVKLHGFRLMTLFSELNGFNFLLKSEIGFWDEMCRIQMPASRF